MTRGELLSQGTFYGGCMKGVYLHAVVGTYSSLAFGILYAIRGNGVRCAQWRAALLYYTSGPIKGYRNMGRQPIETVKLFLASLLTRVVWYR